MDHLVGVVLPQVEMVKHLITVKVVCKQLVELQEHIHYPMANMVHFLEVAQA